MEFLEKDLEEIIFNASDKDLNKKGLSSFSSWRSVTKRKRQLKIGNYGIADMVTFERVKLYPDKRRKKPYRSKLIITVYELKKDAISVSAFFQALRYVKGIKRYLSCRNNFGFDIEYKIVLIGRQDLSTETDVIYLNDIFDNVELYGYNYSIDGLKFKSLSAYCLIKEGFKND